jgi:aminoglycoside 6-adenylyltransferase
MNGSEQYSWLIAGESCRTKVRLDLSFQFTKYIDEGEPAVALLDKDDSKGLLPALPIYDDECWHIEPPSPLYFYSCCNNFWWCLNNVAKGIARMNFPM